MISEFLESNNISNLVDLLRHRAENQPDKTAYIFLVDGENEEVRLTYDELDKQARAIAAELQKSIKQGERALLVYPPGLEFISAFFGCLYSGLIAVPCYPPDPNKLDVSMAKLQGIIADCTPEIILTTKEFLGLAAFIFTDYPDLEKMNWLATDEVDLSLSDKWTEPEINAGSLAFLQYTSGSTGDPKGVMVSHKNALYNQNVWIEATGKHNDEPRIVSWVPVYHDMGLVGVIIHSVYVNAFCVLMSPVHFLKKPARWLRAMSRYKATMTCAPNFAFDLCVKKISSEQVMDLNLGNWQIAACGAEIIRQKTLERFIDKFQVYGLRKNVFISVFGMAESALVATCGTTDNSPSVVYIDDNALKKGQIVSCDSEHARACEIVSCGKPWLDHKVIIVDPDSLVQTPFDEIGEVWLSGSSMASGYWNKAKLTEDMFKAYLSDTGEGPFLRTGDLGFVKNGELFITGRIKDMIIIHGLNYYPHDIELTVAHSHKNLRPGCTAAFSVDISGKEKLVVIQEIKSGLENHEYDEVIQNIRKAVLEEHGLEMHDILLIEAGSIPKTSSGKIRRRACKSIFLERMDD